jgi:hypothetical protein
MMNSNTKIGLAHDHGGYELRENLEEFGPLGSSSTGLNPWP